MVAQLVPNIAYVTNRADRREGRKSYYDGSTDGRWLDLSLGYKGESNPWTQAAVSGVPRLAHLDTYPHAFQLGGYRRKALSSVKPHEDLEPVEHDHPFRRLVENPNPFDTWFDFAYERQMFLELCGVAYTWCVPNAWGEPCELWVIPSHWVWPRTGGGKYVPPDNPHADELIQFYEVRPWGGLGSAGILRFPPNEVVMERWKSPVNKIDGYSKLSAASFTIDTEESVQKSRWAQMQNQAIPSCYVELTPDFSDPDDARIARLEAKFMSKLQGEFNVGRPFFGPPGMKITPISFNPEQMCLDEDTECLTVDGWKSYDELTTDTQVACYDPATDRIVYRKPTEVISFRYDGPMHKWEGRTLDVLATPNHRMYVKDLGHRKNPKDGAWGPVRMRHLSKASDYLLKCAADAACVAPTPVEVPVYRKYRLHEPPVGINAIDPDLWLEFVGYYVSEGCLPQPRVLRQRPCRVVISQSERSPHYAKIVRCLERLPYKWRTYRTGRDTVHWWTADWGLREHLRRHCGRCSRNKRIPRYVKGWPADSLRILLDAAVAGDGSVEDGEDAGVRLGYNTVSKRLADDVQEIGVKCGLRSRFGPGRLCRDGKKMYTVVLYEEADKRVRPVNRSIVDYHGTVWCLKVPTSFFVVRRNGCVHVTGNSYTQTEEQIRGQILSTFQVPEAAVGLVREMTYGSVLATLAAFCQGSIDPRLTMMGQSWTKFLAPKFTRHQHDYEIRIWYDSCIPHDPSQINADIQTDLHALAITPNEVRALRGRKPYRYGGNDPIGSGPGGQIPIPFNTGEDLGEFAGLIEPMAQMGQQGGGQEGGPEGLPAPGQSFEELAAQGGGGQGGQEGQGGEIAQGESSMNPQVAEANNKPSKGGNGVVRKARTTHLDRLRAAASDRVGGDDLFVRAKRVIARVSERRRGQDVAAPGPQPVVIHLHQMEGKAAPPAVHAHIAPQPLTVLVEKGASAPQAPPQVHVNVQPTPVENHVHVPKQPAPNVHVSPTPVNVENVVHVPEQPAPNVHVSPTPVTVENVVRTPEVNVAAPDVSVNVEAPTVHAHNTVELPEQPPPAVTVQPSEVKVHVHPVRSSSRKRVKIERDEYGRPTGATFEE